MGISRLSSVIKKTGGTIASGLKGKKTHVDFLSVYFGLIKSRCYNTVATSIRKDAIAAATAAPPQVSATAPRASAAACPAPSPDESEVLITSTENSKKRRAVEPPDRARPNKQAKTTKVGTSGVSPEQFLSNLRFSAETSPKEGSSVSACIHALLMR